MSHYGTRQVYCLSDGHYVHVSTFAPLPPSLRPPVICPACDQPVVLKLGENRAHHFAHQPDSSCPLNNPESALHFNVKIHLYEQLKQGDKLLLLQRCSGWTAPTIARRPGGHHPCQYQGTKTPLWAEGWDAVEVERYTGSRKPDIVLLRGGLPFAAVEVFATHAVDEQKRLDMLALEIPWVEIKADEWIYTLPDAWQSS